MFKDVLTKEPKYFAIGDFTIAASYNNDFVNEPVDIPGSFMAFETKFCENPDICFVVDKKATVESGKEIHRAQNFMNNAVFEIDDHAWRYLGYVIGDDAGMEFQIEKDFSHILMTKMDAPQKYIMRELGILFECALLSRDACMLHGIIVEHEGRGILVLARSGVGKSTHARLWRDEENALIINGDRCLCRKVDGKWYAYGSPWCGTSGEYINRKVPITNIVFLNRGETNFVKKVNPFSATMRLLECVKAPTWERNLYMKAMDICDLLVQDIPIWNLFCTPDVESVHVLKKALFGEED